MKNEGRAPEAVLPRHPWRNKAVGAAQAAGSRQRRMPTGGSDPASSFVRQHLSGVPSDYSGSLLVALLPAPCRPIDGKAAPQYYGGGGRSG